MHRQCHKNFSGGAYKTDNASVWMHYTLEFTYNEYCKAGSDADHILATASYYILYISIIINRKHEYNKNMVLVSTFVPFN